MSTQYPEAEKLARVGEQKQAILEFLEWCQSEGLWLARYEGQRLTTIMERSEPLVHRFFGLDDKKLEAERRAMLQEFSDARRPSQ